MSTPSNLPPLDPDRLASLMEAWRNAPGILRGIKEAHIEAGGMRSDFPAWSRDFFDMFGAGL